MRAINVVLAVCISLLMALLVFEGGLRLIGFAPEGKILQFDPALGWSKEPCAKLARSTSEFDVLIETNALGLRDDPMSRAAKPAGKFRVVCLGDSFVLGFTVARDELFVDQLEGWWNSEQRNVDVVNAGTQGYSTDQEVLWLMQHGKAFEPDLVLLFPYENDIFWAAQERYFKSPKPRFSANGNIEARELVDPGDPSFFERTAFKKLLDGKSASPPPEYLFVPEGGTQPVFKEHAALLNMPPGFITDAVKRTEGAILALKQSCAELGAKLLVAPIPSRSAVDPARRALFGEKVLGLPAHAWSPDLPVDTYIAICNKLRIPYLDCRADFRERIEKGEQLYYAVDWHLNGDGNRAFASFLHDALENPELDIFPAAHAKQVEGSIPAPRPIEGGARWPYVFAVLWVLLTALYYGTYRDEPLWKPPLAVLAMLSAIFAIVLLGGWGLGQLPPKAGQGLLILFVLGLLAFIVYKLGNRIATILELFVAFTRRGHWYLMPLVVVLLTIGSLLVVAASSPLIAPFIYTLF